MSTTIETPNLNGAAPLPLPPETPLQRLERVKLYLSNGILIKDEDYGIIPGGGKKPTLLKPGAQKLCGLFHLAPIVKDRQRVGDDLFVSYEVIYQVINKESGVIEAEGLGECNSRERRYKNQDTFNITNTLLKMAAKRALVDATLNALGISSIFTQDVEDMDFGGESQPARPAQRQQRAQPQPAAQPKAELAPTISELTNDALLEWIKYARQFDNHPQMGELREEYQRRKAAQDARKATPVTESAQPSEAAPIEAAPPSDAQNGRITALAAANTGDGYARFKAAAANAGMSWESDADVAAFESSVSTLLGNPTVPEELADADWWNLADQLQSGDLGWTL